jgi:hypothetical protein
MVNFLHKKVWDQSDWDIYFNNLEILCRRFELKKYEFNSKIGVNNAFRKDSGRPSDGTILKICKNFDVTEEWLSTLHDLADYFEEELSDIQFSLTPVKKGPDDHLDIELLVKIIERVENRLQKANQKLAAGKKGRLISLLYERFYKTEEEVDDKTVVSYLKLVA